MFFGQANRRSPLDSLMAYVERAGQQPVDVGQAFGTGRRRPGPPLVTSRREQDQAATARLTAPPPRRRSVTIDVDGIGQIQMGPEFNRLSPEEQQAAVEEIAANYTPPEPTGYDATQVSQGLSGVNEGLASTLGMPVDLATMALNAVPAGIDAVAGTNLGRIENPVLGSEWWRERGRDTGSIRPENEAGRFVRRVGQSAGAAAIPIAGTAGSLGQAARLAVPAVMGGVGAATAREVAPGNPIAEIAGEVLGSLGTAGGMAAAGRRSAQRAAVRAVPSTDQLRQQASDLYDVAESRGIVAGPAVTTRISTQIRDIAQREALITPTGRVSEAYPRAAEAMRTLDDYAGHDMNPRQIQVIRETLADAVGATRGKERRIARMMLNAFDAQTTPLAPELAQARGIASRYLQADTIRRTRELAEARAAQFTGSGMENALRTEFRNLDRRITRGQEQLNPDVAQAVRNVSRGTPTSNAARAVGRLAPTGVVSAGLGGGVPFMAGNALGGPGLGGAFAAGTMTLGAAGRGLATRQTEAAARMAEIIARNGGRVPAAMNGGLSQALRDVSPGLSAQVYPTAANDMYWLQRVFGSPATTAAAEEDEYVR